jgi:hypothetical protein
MKIIDTSNFNLDDYKEKVVAEGIANPRLGGIMVDALNAAEGKESATYYRLVPDGYVLSKGFEP